MKIRRLNENKIEFALQNYKPGKTETSSSLIIIHPHARPVFGAPSRSAEPLKKATQELVVRVPLVRLSPVVNRYGKPPRMLMLAVEYRTSA